MVNTITFGATETFNFCNLDRLKPCRSPVTHFEMVISGISANCDPIFDTAYGIFHFYVFTHFTPQITFMR